MSLPLANAFCSNTESLDRRLGLVDKAIVLLLVEEVAVAHVGVRVITGKIVGSDLLIGVAEVNIPHVRFVVQEIGVQSVVVPEVMLVILALPMAQDHVPNEASHPD